MIAYIALGVSVLALAGVIYLFLQLKKVGSSMELLGEGLDKLGKQVQDFAAFMASKL